MADRSTTPSTNETSVGDRVIELRADGRSFASITAELGLGKAPAGFAALVAALPHRPVEEQRAVRRQESRRLDRLEERTRARCSGPELTRKIARIADLRRQLQPT